MTILQSFILGIIQGLTEFLPISSSAHLVLTPYLLGWQIPADQNFVFDVLVQLGTLVAVIAFFWKDLVAIVVAFIKGLIDRKPFAEPQARLGWYIILATIPAGIFGVTIKDAVEAAFANPPVVAVFLLVTAAMLLAAERVGNRTRSLDCFNWKDALWMGIAQAASIFPGISRSGSTISGGVLRNLDRPTAARFSFLMSIPIMLAAGVLSSLDLAEVSGLTDFLPVLLVGVVTAAVVGYLSIRWLLKFITRNSLTAFAVYCIAISGVVLLFEYVL